MYFIQPLQREYEIKETNYLQHQDHSQEGGEESQNHKKGIDRGREITEEWENETHRLYNGKGHFIINQQSMEQGSLIIELYPSVTKYSTAKGIHRETGMKRFKEYRKHHNKIVAVIRNNKI